MKMLEIERNVLNKALNILNSLKLKYAIVLDDGEKLGTLEIATKANKPHASPYKYGELRNYVRPILDAMKPGDAIEIPDKGYIKTFLQNAICAYASETWGHSTYSTTQVANGVQIMRMSEKDLF